jgi:hypothetical protein
MSIVFALKKGAALIDGNTEFYDNEYTAPRHELCIRRVFGFEDPKGKASVGSTSNGAREGNDVLNAELRVRLEFAR